MHVVDGGDWVTKEEGVWFVCNQRAVTVCAQGRASL